MLTAPSGGTLTSVVLTFTVITDLVGEKNTQKVVPSTRPEQPFLLISSPALPLFARRVIMLSREGAWASASSTMWLSLPSICGDRLLMVLEGGYNPVSLEACVLTTCESLLTTRPDRIGVFFSERAKQLIKNHPLRNYWTLY